MGGVGRLLVLLPQLLRVGRVPEAGPHHASSGTVPILLNLLDTGRVRPWIDVYCLLSLSDVISTQYEL